MKSEIKKKERSQIEISGVISKEVLAEEREKVLRNIAKEIEISGFRKGQAPEERVIQKVGEMAILEKAAEAAISHFYEEIIKTEKLDPIGRPEVIVTKLALGNDIEFKIITAVVPQITLPPYTQIAKLKNKEKKAPEEGEDKGKRRMAILEDIVTAGDIDLPDIIVANELQKMMLRFKDDIASAGLDFKEHLSKNNISEEQLFKEWQPHAEKKAKIQLILNEIAHKEKIEADRKLLEEEVATIMKTYPQANPHTAYMVAETALVNEAVLNFLENIIE